MTEPCDLSAVEARRLIGICKLSPVELLESCIRRIEAVNPAVNAVVTTDYDGARRTAQAQADAEAEAQAVQCNRITNEEDQNEKRWGLRRVRQRRRPGLRPEAEAERKP